MCFRSILTPTKKYPCNSKHELSISNNKVSVKVGTILGCRKCSILSFLKEKSFVTLIASVFPDTTDAEVGENSKGYFVTLIEIGVHLIT